MDEFDKDVTNLMYFAGPDDELLPVTKCVCGSTFTAWDFIIGIYRETPYSCPNCDRKFYFSNDIRIYEINAASRD